MEIKYDKSSGNDDFHQELTDFILSVYQNIDDLITELLLNGKNLNVKRENNKGYINFCISNIDLNNEIVTINRVEIRN